MEKINYQDYLLPVPENENPLPTGRGGASFCKVEDDIYLYGGADRFQTCYGNYLHIFNTKSLSWRLESGLLLDKRKSNNNKCSSSSSSIEKEKILTTSGLPECMLTYDTNISPSPRSGHSCTHWKENNSLFFFGGINFQEEKCFNDSYIYHLPSKLWYNVTNILKKPQSVPKVPEALPAQEISSFCNPPEPPLISSSSESPKFEEVVTGRNSHSCVSLSNNRMLIYGGACEDGVLDEVFIVHLSYSTIEKKYYATWEAMKKPVKDAMWPGGREMHAACSQENDGIIISGGRAEDGSVYKDIWMLLEIPFTENEEVLSSKDESSLEKKSQRGINEKEKIWKWIKLETDLCNPICAHTMTLYHTLSSSSSVSSCDTSVEDSTKKISNISLVLFGGFDGLATIHNEVQVLPLSYSTLNTTTTTASRKYETDFQSLSITEEITSMPKASTLALSVEAEAGGRGPAGGNGSSILKAKNGGWLYKGQIGYSPIGGPEARFAHSMVYDQSEERLYIFGGVNIQQDMDDVIILKGVVSEKNDKVDSSGRKE